MRFWLGTPEPSWLRRPDVGVELMVSRMRLKRLKTLPRAILPWVLDSGGFSELSPGKGGTWSIGPHEYAAVTRRYHDEIGLLEWAAPQDWMCEPDALAETGLTVEEHQKRTVHNYLDLKTLWPDGPHIPVLQGWTRDDYLRCVDMYSAVGVDLESLPVVGLGSVCRRQATGEAEWIVQSLQPLRLHGFGMKAEAVARFGSLLVSADSQAWSYGGRWRPDSECGKASCSWCVHRALEWRHDVLHPDRPSLYGVAAPPAMDWSERTMDSTKLAATIYMGWTGVDK